MPSRIDLATQARTGYAFRLALAAGGTGRTDGRSVGVVVECHALAALAVGDVVKIDATSTTSGGKPVVTKTTVAAEQVFGVVIEAAAALYPVRVLTLGAIGLVTLGGTVTSGQYLYASSSGTATGSASLVDGVFGIALHGGASTDQIPAWIAGGMQGALASAAILESLIDAKGDLIAGTANDTAARLAIGTNGYALIADSSVAPGMAWTAQKASIVAVIDGAGAAISTGVKGDIRVPFACTIERASLLADQTGSIVVDIWVDTYANYPPTVADTITAAAKPTLSSALTASDTTLTGWTVALAEGSTIRYNVDSAATVQRVTLELKVRRT